MKSGTGPESLPCEALLVLLRTADTVWAASRVFFEKWRISPSQFNVLNLLRAAPDGLSQIELSRRLIVHRSNVTGLIDRLEARGLVSRKDVKVDRRAYSVVLTGEGFRLLDQILPAYYSAAERLWSVVPEKRLPMIIKHLQQIANSAQQAAKNTEQSRVYEATPGSASRSHTASETDPNHD